MPDLSYEDKQILLGVIKTEFKFLDNIPASVVGFYRLEISRTLPIHVLHVLREKLVEYCRDKTGDHHEMLLYDHEPVFDVATVRYYCGRCGISGESIEYGAGHERTREWEGYIEAALRWAWEGYIETARDVACKEGIK